MGGRAGANLNACAACGALAWMPAVPASAGTARELVFRRAWLGTPSRCPRRRCGGARHNGGCREPEGRRRRCPRRHLWWRMGQFMATARYVNLDACGQVPPQRLPGSGRLDAGCCLSRGSRAACGALASSAVEPVHGSDGARLARGRKARDGTDHTAARIAVRRPLVAPRRWRRLTLMGLHMPRRVQAARGLPFASRVTPAPSVASVPDVQRRRQASAATPPPARSSSASSSPSASSASRSALAAFCGSG